MLKEFDFLGFEDYYGGWSESHFLRQAIANFEKTATFNWVKDREFFQISKDRLESCFLEHPLTDESGKEMNWLEEVMANLNAFIMPHPVEDVLVLSGYYVGELLEWIDDSKLNEIEIIPYDYQHLK